MLLPNCMAVCCTYDMPGKYTQAGPNDQLLIGRSAIRQLGENTEHPGGAESALHHHSKRYRRHAGLLCKLEKQMNHGYTGFF